MPVVSPLISAEQRSKRTKLNVLLSTKSKVLATIHPRSGSRENTIICRFERHRDNICRLSFIVETLHYFIIFFNFR